MDKGKFYSGLAIMVGLIVLGFNIPKAVSDYRSFDRTVIKKRDMKRTIITHIFAINIVSVIRPNIILQQRRFTELHPSG